MDAELTKIIPEDQEEKVDSLQKHEIIQGIFYLLAVIGILFLMGKFINLEDVQGYIQDLGPIGPIVFIIMKAASIVIAPIVGGPIYFIAGPLFGFWKALAYTLIGDAIGSGIAFLLARKFGRKIINIFFSERLMNIMDKMLNKIETWKGLLYARLLLYTLHDLVSYAAGLTKIKFSTFIIVSTLTFIIPNALAIGLGLAVVEKNIVTIVIISLITLAIIGILYEISRKKKKPLENNLINL
jgi:uncharacterized membrane protein YdjX (TVP38/TMEM64 family)